MQYLDLKNCGLSNLNIQKLKNLKFVNLKNNSLGVNIFLQIIENHSNLEHIWLDNSFLIETSFDIIKNENNLKILKIKRSDVLITHFTDYSGNCKQLVFTLSKLDSLILSKISKL